MRPTAFVLMLAAAMATIPASVVAVEAEGFAAAVDAGPWTVRRTDEGCTSACSQLVGTLTITALNGYAGRVDAYVPAPPPGTSMFVQPDALWPSAEGSTVNVYVFEAGISSGTYPVDIELTDPDDPLLKQVVTVDLNVDTSPPTVSAATLRFPTGKVQIGAGSFPLVPLTMEWTVEDDGNTVASEIEANGPGWQFYPETYFPGKSPSVTTDFYPGGPYHFRTWAWDAAGNWANFWTPNGVSSDDWNVAVVQSDRGRTTGTWVGAAGGEVIRSKTRGSTYRLRFSGAGVAWVSRTSARGGVAKVFIDGELKRRVSMASDAVVPRVLVFRRMLDWDGRHTIEIKVVSGTVDIDSMVVLDPSSCDAAYPSICVPPPPPDLNCTDIVFHDFTVLSPDPHGFDGDADGIGCET